MKKYFPNKIKDVIELVNTLMNKNMYSNRLLINFHSSNISLLLFNFNFSSSHFFRFNFSSLYNL